MLWRGADQTKTHSAKPDKPPRLEQLTLKFFVKKHDFPAFLNIFMQP
jgi:hypothetical protein